MILQSIFLILISFIFNGCSITQYRNHTIHSIDAGYEVDNIFENLTPNDIEIDKITQEVKLLLENNGYKTYSSKISYGLIPHTGHTTYFLFDVSKKRNVHGFVTLSKRKFLVKFFESYNIKEKKILITQKDTKKINNISLKIRKLIKKKYSTRSIRVSNYIN